TSTFRELPPYGYVIVEVTAELSRGSLSLLEATYAVEQEPAIVGGPLAAPIWAVITESAASSGRVVTVGQSPDIVCAAASAALSATSCRWRRSQYPAPLMSTSPDITSSAIIATAPSTIACPDWPPRLTSTPPAARSARRGGRMSP